ncbi:MAG: AAA family ATPase [Burkholderiales bacterium]
MFNYFVEGRCCRIEVSVLQRRSKLSSMSKLLERDALLAVLGEHARAAAEGRGHTVLVSGEAGIGKTALLERFAAEYGSGRVLWGGCEALATPRPLGPLHDIAGSAAAGLRARLSANGDRAAVFGAVLEEIGRPPAPTVVVFEDIHWADEATLDLVKFLGRRIQRVPALLLLSHRDDVASLDRLRSLLGELPASHVSRVTVPTLTRKAVEQLAAVARRGDAAGIYSVTGGNAFFVAELLRQSGADGVVPASVRDAVLGRAARLPAAAIEVLHLLAIVPRQVEPALAEALLGKASDAVATCLASGLLLAEGRALRFRHELARTAIEAAIPAPRAAQLHARVLAALAALPDAAAPLAARAHHAHRAGDAEAVLRWAPLAVREAAMRGSRREAAAHCQIALAYADRLTDAQHASVLDELATHSFELNDLATAIAAREQSIALYGDDRPEQRSLSLSAHAMSLVRALRNADADAASQRAIAIAQTLPPSRARARAYATESYLRMLNRDYAAAIDWGEKALALAERVGDLATKASALVSLGAALMFVDYPRGCASVTQSLELARSLADGGAGVADAYVMLGTASGELHEFDAAERYLADGIAFARARDLDRLAGYMESWQALCDLYRGRWTLCGERANAAVDQQPGGTTNRVAALIALGKLRTRRGDPGGNHVLDEALKLAELTGTLQRLGPVCAARAEAAWTAGDDAGALREAERVLALAASKRHPWLLGELAFWCACAGRSSGAALDECAEPFRLQIQGHWKEAAAAWRGMGCPYEEARALGDGDEAAQRVALDILDGLGARPLAERIRRQLRQAGARAVPRGAQARTRANAAGLTAREFAVLELLADGWRNAQIAQRLSRSPRTVEHHVEAILGKLDVATRGEAVATARRRGLLPKNG